MHTEQLKPNTIVTGPLFPEPVSVWDVQPVGGAYNIKGSGLRTGRAYNVVLSPDQVAQLQASPETEPFDGVPQRFRLGVEAIRLGLAYEYDPFFSLSIARVDPLPHQMEAVYDYFLKLPRIRFLLADDPGAGKTIMAGLLLKELKARGLVSRTLIVSPANLCFQWSREMRDKFHEHFTIMKGDVLRATYGTNPWLEHNQVVTSVSWVSCIEDANASLLQSHWDLVIVDEAHKMSAYSSEKKTLAYRLGEELSDKTDHLLLMTATPHKGDPKNFCLFLELLDKDVYGDVASLEDAMQRNVAPFYLRRTKEALVTFPDPDTGEVKKIFTNREVHTAQFMLDDEEYDFYHELTAYVETQSVKAEQEGTAHGRAVGFTMAMLQRRFASSVRAARRSLERMRDKRQKILDDPEEYRKKIFDKGIPDDFDDLDEEDREKIIQDLEAAVASMNPEDLRAEIVQLNKLIDHALRLEQREVESKLVKLREIVTDQGVFSDPKMKLLIFTEHKDTLDYLVEKLRDDWGLSVTQIHGGMIPGDRDRKGTRLAAEREFREEAQVMVATEAAGEGINLQFCWFMINYDIPWNPVRLEQRMGRIHRYGQEHDCVIYNFVSTRTREGRVLNRLLERLAAIRQELGTDQVFDVVGEVFPANLLEKLFRDMYAKKREEKELEARIVKEVDVKRFRKITESMLEGLAKRNLNLASLVGRSAEARERRLVPEAVEDFFMRAAPLADLNPQQVRSTVRTYRIGRVPSSLRTIGEKQPFAQRYGKLGEEYKLVVFDKEFLKQDPTLEWVTPGHPLFEAVRERVLQMSEGDLRRGAVFYDLHRAKPYLLDLFTAEVLDGTGNCLHRRLFVVETDDRDNTSIRQPTLLFDLIDAPAGTPPGPIERLPDREGVGRLLYETALQPFLQEVATERQHELDMIERHVKVSLDALITRAQLQWAELDQQKRATSVEQGLEGRLKMAFEKIERLNRRRQTRLEEIARERQCMIGEIQHVGRAWVLPHPDRERPEIKPILRDEDIERIAVQAVVAYEQQRGREVESVERDNRGFDLISRKPHPEDPKTATEVRFIEVKGRAAEGGIALTPNEYMTAQRLKQDYWLYVVFNCGSTPEVVPVRDPARIDWTAITRVQHYQTEPEALRVLRTNE